MIILFETYAGLCNQMFDILSAVFLMKDSDFQYSFRSASFRRPNLLHFYNVPFLKLFSEEPYLREKNYIPYLSIINKINRRNTFNFDGKRAIHIWKPHNFKKDIHELSKKYEYIVIRQLWPLHLSSFKNIDILEWVKPNQELLDTYHRIKEKIEIPKEYIFLHYRYEKDFIKFFQIKVPDINGILEKINLKKKPIYIASTNLDQLLENKESSIFYKNEHELKKFNFEEKAMIDFLFGIDSQEIYGNRKSSFSNVLNDIKGTNTYYS